MPKLPAAGTCPSSILARTPDTSPIHRVVPVQVVMPGGHAPLALRADARRCSSRQSLATLDALHAPARVGAVARLVPTARIIFASHLVFSSHKSGTGPQPASSRPSLEPYSRRSSSSIRTRDSGLPILRNSSRRTRTFSSIWNPRIAVFL